MAHAYTPGLSVKKQTVIRRERRLPLTGDVLKTVGDTVGPRDLVARTELPGNVRVVNAANTLGVAPDELADALLVAEGSTIAREQLIAESKGMFGLFKSQVKSPIDGTLESASPVTGQMILREPPIPVELTAYVGGVVEEVYENEGVMVRTQGALIQGIFGIGCERCGPVAMAVDSPDISLTADMLQESHAGAIVVGGAYVTYDVLQRAGELGIAAIVAGGFPYADLKSILGYEVGVAITGTEDIPTTLILTEGFGAIGMARRTYELLATCVSREASVNGATQIRAGVIRPEIVIPDTTTEIGSQPTDDAITGLDIESQIRVIRNPYFGHLGTVTQLPDQLQQLETGAMVRVLEVRFTDGSTAIVPRANVELIDA
jgi:hypothetical protein